MNTTIEKSEISRLIDIVENLNARLSAIESSVSQVSGAPVVEVKKVLKKESSEDMELRIGEQWFGKIGIIAFLFAVFYLLTLPFQSFAALLVVAAGYLIASVMIALSFYKNMQLKSLSGYIAGCGITILYFTTLKLHFFSENPFIADSLAIVPLLFIVSVAGFYAALKKSSPHLTAISFVLFSTTALLSDNVIILFSSMVLLAFISIHYGTKNNWEGIIIFTIPLTYIVLFLWFINNPLLGKALSLTQDSGYSILIIPLLISIFGFSQSKQRQGETDNYQSVLKTLLNSVPGYLLFIYMALNANAEYSALLNFLISILLLSLAAFYWIRERSKISTFIYSMVGYGALSLAIILNFNAPDYFIWLCWQSLLVVSTALWFRSRFIVVANFFIFISLTVTYLLSGGEYGVEGLSFGLVSLFSARLMNINQKRLELQSEHLRNGYLVTAMLVIPFILYSILPDYLVGISWIVLSYLYYIMGKLINNKKYRLMASGTLILSLLYIFLFGLTSGDAAYKIVSFMLISIALVIVSVVYSRVRTKETLKEG